MNTNALNKLYDRLTARERVALMIAAAHRADDSERRRLADSAPKLRWEVSHHYGLATALIETAHLHLLTLLDLAAKYWQGWGLWGWQGRRCQVKTVADSGAAAGGCAADAGEVRLHGLVRYHAFLFATHVDGWKRFCADWPMEPEALLDYLPGWDVVIRTETAARQHAYAPEEAAFFLLSETPVSEEPAEDVALPAVITAEGLAEAWHTIVERLLGSPLGEPR